MAKRFIAPILLTAGLAGCNATPVEHRNYREIDPSQGMFADGLKWEWRRKADAPAEPANVKEEEEFKKWRETAGASERKEFEDWRAWQEWKRKNPK